MGIPRFAYRMRDYALTQIIGAETITSQSQTAVIDGPSLAHFVFQTTKWDEKANSGIATQCNYADLGKAVIKWLDRLQLYGFEM